MSGCSERKNQHGVRVLKKRFVIGLVIAIPVAIATFAYAVYRYRLTDFLDDFSGTVIRRSHLGNEYNREETVFYLFSPFDVVATNKNMNQLPWGINRRESKVLFRDRRPLLYENVNRLIFGSCLLFDDHSFGKTFVELHFNNDGRLYKIVETWVEKYLYYERIIPDVEIFVRYKGASHRLFFNSIENMNKQISFASSSNILYWVDQNGEQKSAAFERSPIVLPEELVDILDEQLFSYEDLYQMIIENDFVVERNRAGNYGTHVNLHQITRRVGDNSVLTETSIINSLLDDS